MTQKLFEIGVFKHGGEIGNFKNDNNDVSVNQGVIFKSSKNFPGNENNYEKHNVNVLSLTNSLQEYREEIEKC